MPITPIKFIGIINTLMCKETIKFVLDHFFVGRFVVNYLFSFRGHGCLKFHFNPFLVQTFLNNCQPFHALVGVSVFTSIPMCGDQSNGGADKLFLSNVHFFFLFPFPLNFDLKTAVSIQLEAFFPLTSTFRRKMLTLVFGIFFQQYLPLFR